MEPTVTAATDLIQYHSVDTQDTSRVELTACNSRTNDVSSDSCDVWLIHSLTAEVRTDGRVKMKIWGSINMSYFCCLCVDIGRSRAARKGWIQSWETWVSQPCLVTVTPWLISGGGVGNLSRIETSLGAIKWDAVE